MRIVVDTNVVVSAVFWGGKPLEVLRTWAKGRFEVVASPEILWEYEQTLLDLTRENITTDLRYWLGLLNERVRLIQPHLETKLCRDPNDDKFLSCAVSEDADYFISGDRDLLDLKEVEGIEILNPASFLKKHQEMLA